MNRVGSLPVGWRGTRTVAKVVCSLMLLMVAACGSTRMERNNEPALRGGPGSLDVKFEPYTLSLPAGFAEREHPAPSASPGDLAVVTTKYFTDDGGVTIEFGRVEARRAGGDGTLVAGGAVATTQIGGRSITRVTGYLTPPRIADSWLVKSVLFTLTVTTADPARSASLLDSLEASLKG